MGISLKTIRQNDQIKNYNFVVAVDWFGGGSLLFSEFIFAVFVWRYCVFVVVFSRNHQF